jgi:asparagine synthase (glutamine-hydrolysing)
MCGIAGLVGAGDAATMARMVDVQRHRGPDDQGVAVFPEERVLLGHRRRFPLRTIFGTRPDRGLVGRPSAGATGGLACLRQS